MLRASCLALLVSAAAWGQSVTEVGDVVVVRDLDGGISYPEGFPGLQMSFCRDAYNRLRTILPDDYDGVIAFSTTEDWQDAQNTWQGTPVHETATGIGRSTSPFANQYNSTHLQQCTFMGTLGHTQALFGPAPEPIPPNPTDVITIMGLFHTLTGIEMLGHEYGHHWLMGVEFDMNDGKGHRGFIRGCEGGDPQNGTPCSPNQHYSGNTVSQSVMYGNCGTHLDGGSWLMSGCPRKYNQLDQYLMGLRAPSEVQPLVVLDDGSGEGNPAQPLTKGATLQVDNMSEYDVGATEVIRAMGPRSPAYPSAQSCWRVAFVVVLPPGQTTVPAAAWTKLLKYQAMFPAWFSQATDGRGRIETRLHVNGCLLPPPDAGAVVDQDAGTDADGGSELVPDDGGAPATFGDDAGRPSRDTTQVPLNDTGRLRPGCGCSEGGAVEGLSMAFAIAAALELARRRRAAH